LKLWSKFVVKSCFKAFANDYKRLETGIGAMGFGLIINCLMTKDVAINELGKNRKI
jgi:hypothetical protein